MNGKAHIEENAVAYVLTAVPLTQQELRELKTILRQKLNREFSVENAVDDSVIAGMSIRVEDRVFDDTVKTKLDRLRERLLA